MSTWTDAAAASLFLIEFPLYLAICIRLAWDISGGVLDLIDAYFFEDFDDERL